MKFTVLTLFPEILTPFFESSIMARAVKRGLVDYTLVNIRNFAYDKHRSCDDYPYGGGAGMVLKPEPLAQALDSVKAKGKKVIFPTPSGKSFTQADAKRLSLEEDLVFICGRYEGIDQRIIDEYVDEEYSIGDYVLSSGEIATLVMVDALYRLRDGVITGESLEEESFEGSLLEYPHYTRPDNFRGADVPEVLLSGNHAEIEKWRLMKQLQKTLKNRPDLINIEKLSKEAVKILNELEKAGGFDNGFN